MVEIMKDLPGSALAVYRREKRNETLQYFPSEAYKEPNELQTEIRICPSLSEKPGKDDDEEDDKSEEQKQKEKEDKPDDVFDSRYWGPLLVKRFDAGGESFGFLLNMNAVVPMHSIIVTKHFEHQYKSASAAQLLAAYTVLASLRSVPVYEKDGKSRTGGGKFVAFFNCNKLSGASQPHKHLQFLPLEGEDGLGDFPIERAARRHKQGQQLQESFSIPSLPYVHFIKRLSLPAAGEELATYLHETYKALLNEMVETLKGHPDCKTTALNVEDGLSYNVIITDEHMHIMPRRDDTFILREPESEGNNTATTEPEELSVNSIAYCGTVLVKDENDDQRLRKLGGVLAVLEHCGFTKSKLKYA